ncbi:Pentatricopeptide repeat-containing protein mitochondrial [Zea mays]|uniref:Pentatricopeptide repeat-containing protein mitochondrial n=1 Tax=Zea mays TaxID=4577 RepID=A0A1D6L3X1_MAIZE|nr:Pentatricopeptide repeat-containing protein mitochondrial [Zea mays]
MRRRPGITGLQNVAATLSIARNFQNQLGLVGENMAKVGTDVMKKQRLGMVRSQLEKFACKHKVIHSPAFSSILKEKKT